MESNESNKTKSKGILRNLCKDVLIEIIINQNSVDYMSTKECLELQKRLETRLEETRKKDLVILKKKLIEHNIPINEISCLEGRILNETVEIYVVFTNSSSLNIFYDSTIKYKYIEGSLPSGCLEHFYNLEIYNILRDYLLTVNGDTMFRLIRFN